jgi:hypothetical protein
LARSASCHKPTARFSTPSRTEEGLSDGWKPIRAYWKDASQTNREALRAFLSLETTVWQYTHGVPDPTSVSPDGYSLDTFYMGRPGAAELQLDLFGDYKSNVALYPTFQKYFRTYKPPLLAVWGKNDPFFLPRGAEAFKRDIPDAVVRFFDTGHFALTGMRASRKDWGFRPILGANLILIIADRGDEVTQPSAWPRLVTIRDCLPARAAVFEGALVGTIYTWRSHRSVLSFRVAPRSFCPTPDPLLPFALRTKESPGPGSGTHSLA